MKEVIKGHIDSNGWLKYHKMEKEWLNYLVSRLDLAIARMEQQAGRSFDENEVKALKQNLLRPGQKIPTEVHEVKRVFHDIVDIGIASNNILYMIAAQRLDLSAEEDLSQQPQSEIDKLDAMEEYFAQVNEGFKEVAEELKPEALAVDIETSEAERQFIDVAHKISSLTQLKLRSEMESIQNGEQDDASTKAIAIYSQYLQSKINQEKKDSTNVSIFNSEAQYLNQDQEHGSENNDAFTTCSQGEPWYIALKLLQNVTGDIRLRRWFLEYSHVGASRSISESVHFQDPDKATRESLLAAIYAGFYSNSGLGQAHYGVDEPGVLSDQLQELHHPGQKIFKRPPSLKPDDPTKDPLAH